jgi:hypothetical protein
MYNLVETMGFFSFIALIPQTVISLLFYKYNISNDEIVDELELDFIGGYYKIETIKIEKCGMGFNSKYGCIMNIVESNNSRQDGTPKLVTCWIFKGFSSKFDNLLNNRMQKHVEIDIEMKEMKTPLYIKTKKVETDSTYHGMKTRTVCTLNCPTKDQEKVVDKVLKLHERCIENDIIFKCGILLYGPPGTGKSTIKRFLCDKLPNAVEYDIQRCKNEYFSMEGDLIQFFKKTKENIKIISIEEIDSVIENIINYENGEKVESTTSNLFTSKQDYNNFIDNIMSNENVILLLTSNKDKEYFENKSYFRDGRIDLKEYVGHIDYSELTRIAKRLDPSINTENIGKDYTVARLEKEFRHGIGPFSKSMSMSKSKPMSTIEDLISFV